MLHSVILASTEHQLAAGLILKGIKGIFLLIGGFIAAILCGIIASFKGRNPLGWNLRILLLHHHAYRRNRHSQQEMTAGVANLRQNP
jgi:hypothetical protein